MDMIRDLTHKIICSLVQQSTTKHTPMTHQSTNPSPLKEQRQLPTNTDRRWTMVKTKRYMVLKSFLDEGQQRSLCAEALGCAEPSSANQGDGTSDLSSPLPSALSPSPQSSSCAISQRVDLPLSPPSDYSAESTASCRLELGISCGGDLRSRLPLATSSIQRALQSACDQWKASTTANENARIQQDIDVLTTLSMPGTPLTGLALLYGPKASMNAHYDSPTQAGQRSEWLCCLSFGSDCVFRCNDEYITMQSGDALVMDSLSVLHGVERIDDARGHCCGLPQGSRLGILMWRGNGASASSTSSLIMPLMKTGSAVETSTSNDGSVHECMEGISGLFGDTGSDSDS